MYELVWKGSTFSIVRSRHRSPVLTPPFHNIALPANESYREVDLQVWKRFVVERGTVDLEQLQQPIRASWQRCKKMGVDPSYGKCWDIRPAHEFDDNVLQLQELIKETRSQIYSLVRGKELLVTVSDRHGYLVSMCGDYKALLAADKLNFGPGANWSEASVGTNAIGTALTSGQPIRVVGHEHYCQGHHGWICSAAPIYDLHGEVFGCIDISGPKSADHSYALALAVKGARAIETRLFRNEALDLQEQSNRLIHSMFSAVNAGLLYLDIDGVVKAANRQAEIMLGGRPGELADITLKRTFRLQRIISLLKAVPHKYEHAGVEVRCEMRDLDARAFPILSRNGVLGGILLVLSEKYPPRHSLPSAPQQRRDPFAAIIGGSPEFMRSIDAARRIAMVPTTVFISGESGTGKDLLARAIHQAGPRAKGPFVAVNCGAIPAELIQSLLFGYVEGAFTGARRKGSPGQFEAASGGTLFLDEIAEMPLPLQVNLLRVLEERRITRVGATQPIDIDVRLIAASNKDLQKEVAAGRFRSDLFYRLNVVRITLPPLRQRREDIKPLADHFIARLARELKQPVRAVDPSFYQQLLRYPWPGNVRELRHAVEAAIALMNGRRLSAETLPEHIRSHCEPVREPAHQPLHPDDFNLQQLEKETIRRAYHHFQGNISRMAKALGIGRNTLYAKLKRFDLMGKP